MDDVKSIDELNISRTPWFIGDGITEGIGEVLCQSDYRVHGHKIVAHCNNMFPDIVENDARLISSAPDLYDALEFVFKNCTIVGEKSGEAIQKIIGALKKASEKHD